MEIQCAMPVKAVESSCPGPHVCPATLIFRFSSEYLELPDVKINDLFSHEASFKYRNVSSHALKKLHIATPATRPDATVAFHCCMS